MIARAGSGWQTVLADLSLILFMITAAAVAKTPARSAAPSLPLLPALGSPVAVWSAAPGGPALTAWLAHNAADPRLRLTIVAPPAAAQAALALGAASGRPARVLIEPGMQGPPIATLTYDQGGLAQSLREPLSNPPAKETQP